MRSHNADLSPPQIYFAVYQSLQTLIGYSKKEYDVYRRGRQKLCTADLEFLIGWNTLTVSSCDARLDHIVLLEYLQVLLRRPADRVQLHPRGGAHWRHSGWSDIQLCCGWRQKERPQLASLSSSYKSDSAIIWIIKGNMMFPGSGHSPLFNSFDMFLSNSLCIWKQRGKF